MVVFEKKKRNLNNEKEKVFTIFGHEASLKEMRWLFIILVQATLLAFAHVFNIGNAAASAIGILSATGLIIYNVGLVFLKLLNEIRSHKCCINCIKLFAAAEILMFCQVLALLPMISTIGGGYFALLTPEIFATFRSSYKTLAMNFMIVSSILSFPWNKFRKIEYDEL